MSSTTIYVRLKAGLAVNTYNNESIAISGGGATSAVTASGSVASAACTNPTITTQPSTTAQNLCQNATATALSVTASGTTLTYQWYSNTANANTGGTLLSGATSSSYTPSATTTGTLYYYVIVSSGTCTTTSNVSGAVTVTASSTIAISSAAGTDAQTVGQNNAITNITYTIGGGGTGATVTGLPTGVTGSYATGTFTISGSPGVSGVFNYTVTATGGCNNNPQATGSITVTSASLNLAQSGFTSVLTPLYMASGTSTRLPVMFRATVTGLTANTTYRYYAQGATNSSANGASLDFGNTSTGAGNPLLINSTGTTYTYTTSPSYTTAGAYETFTTNASGNYTGWFGFVNTGNSRFTAGNLIYPSIAIADNSGALVARRALDASITVLSFTTNGSFFQSVTSATDKNLAVLFDNTGATGRPLSITPVENTGAAIASVIPGYSTTSGSWNAILPNTNANGVRAIEQLSVTTGNLVGCIATSATGVWPTGSISTVNPSNGTTVKIISGNDDPLVVPAITTQPSTTAQTTCQNGTAFAALTVAATGGTITYQWYSNTANSNSGGSLISGATSSSYTPANTTAGILYYYVTATNNSCSTTSSVSGAFTVNATTTMTTNPTGATYCQNATATALTVAATGSGTLTYQWFSNATNSNTGGTSLGTANGAQTASYTPPTTTAGTVYYYAVVTGTCGNAASSAAAVTVTAQPSATISYAGTPYCSNAGTATVTRTGTTGGTYSAASALTLNATTGDITLATSTPGTYTVTYTVAASGGCSMYTTNTTVTITAAPSATIAYGGTPYCASAGTANVTQTGTTGGTYSSAIGLALNATTGDITLATSTPNTYTVTYTVAASGGCAVYTTNTTVTVTTAPSATISYTSSPYCSNGGTASVTRTGTTGGAYSSATGLSINATTGDINLGASTAGTYTVTYTIAASGGCASYTTNTSVTISAAPSATISYGGTPYCASASTANVTQTGTTGGTYSSAAGLSLNASTGDITLGSSTPGTYMVTYTVTASGGCALYTTNTSVTVTAAPSATISYAGTPYCTGNGTALVTQTGTGGGTYSSTAGLSVNASTGDVTLGSSTPGTYTVTYTVAASGGCSIYTTNTSIVINASVTPAVSITATPSGAVCTGTSVTFTATSVNGGTTPAYQWQLNGGNINGANGSTYTSSALNNGDKIDVVLTSNATCATVTTVTSNIITMMVNSSVAPSITIATTTNPACVGSSVTFTSSVSGGGSTPSYQWQVNGSNAPGASTGSTYTTSSLVTGDQITCVLTSNAACAVPATATSNTIVETINPTTVINTNPVGATYCQNATATALTVNASGSSLTYQWYSNTTNSNSGGTNLGNSNGAQTASYTPPTTVAGTTYYYVTVTGDCGNATSGTATIVVKPTTVITSNPAGATYCQGATPTALTVGTSGSTLTYQWYSNTTNSTTGGTSLGAGNGAQTASYTPPTAIAGTVYYYVTVSGDCGSATSATAAVTVTAQPSATISYSGAPYCSTVTSATPTQTGTMGGTYSSTSGLNITSSGIINPSASTPGTYTVTYTVAPSGGCSVYATTTSVTIVANATIALTSAAGTDNQSVVQGNAIANITYSISNGTGATITGLPTGVTGTYNAGTFTISGAPTIGGTFNYTVTTTNTANCNSSATGTILVCAIPAQDTGITFPAVTANSLSASWTVGDGTGRVVIMNTTNSFTNPANSATLPSANTVYGGTGQQVVYNGTGNTVTVTNLTASTTYWFRVYEYNFCSNQYVFDTAAVTANHNPNSKATSGALLVKSNFTSVLTPKYMAAASSSQRLAIMFRATVTGLNPNTNYRYYINGANSNVANGGTADFGTTNSGAGNPLFINSAGTVYKYSTSASVNTAGGYDSLTTDASGNYTGWFGFVNTGSARFTAGNYVFPTITLGNATGTTLYRFGLADSIMTLAFSTTSSATSGSFLQSKTAATARNLAAIFDNTAASGRPLFIAPIEYISSTGANFVNRPTGYDSSAGAWNAIVPNINANGVRAIEQLSVTTGALVGCIATDADGQWSTGRIDTRNPANGATVRIINGADDPLATCPVYPATAVQQGATSYASNSTYTYANTIVGSNTDVTFTISNSGSGPLNISSLSITNTGAAVFSLQGAAPTTVAAGSSATFVVRFTPNSAATFTGKITINTNDTAQANNPYIVNLNGTGYNIPVISVSQGATSYASNSTYTYPNTIVGSNTDVTFTINNTGAAALNVSSLNVTNAGATVYTLQGTAPTTVAANSSATFVVRFAPSAANTFTGAIVINSNDPNQGTYTVNLSGTGTNTIITTGTIGGSPFCVSASAGAALSVSFTYTPVNAYTTFTAQLSDASGSFTSPTNIGTISSDGSGSQTISATIPAGTAAGSNYLVRVISSSPAVTGSTSSSVLVVSNPVTPSVSITRSPSSAVVCSNSSVVFTATPVNGGSTPTYAWYDNGVVSGVTGNTYTVNAPVNGEQVYAVLTTSLSCYTTPAATSNTITLTVSNPVLITLTSGAGTDAQTVTQGVAINNITYSISSNATNVTLTGTLPTGVTGSLNAGVYTISGTPTQTGTFNYTLSATGGCNNSPTASGSITVSTARIILADNGTQPGTKNITTGSANNVLSTFQITNNLATTTTLTQAKAPLTSNYKAADIAGFKLFTNTVNNLTTAAQLGTTQTSISGGSGETVTFGSLSQTLAINTTYYYWLMADITSNATTGDSITASANPASNFTFSGVPSVSGSVSKAGAQIIASGAVAPAMLTVLRLGDGKTTPTAVAFPVNIWQYNTTGTSQTGQLLVTMPTDSLTGAKQNKALVQSATATSEGSLNLSGNGRLLTLVGYNAKVGTASVASGSAGTAAQTAAAVIGKVDAYLNVNTVTSFDRASTYIGNNFRSAITVDGKSYWGAGTSTATPSTGGIRYILDSTSLGTGTQIDTLNARVINIASNQLYVSSGSSKTLGINNVGTGLPTSYTTSTPLTTVNPNSAYSFVFLNSTPKSQTPDLLYVAGTGSGTADNGIYKYYLSGSTWVSAGSALSSISVYGLTGVVDTSGNVVLYATINTTKNAKPNQLVRYQDNAKPTAAISLATGSVLAASGSLYTFGGVAFTPIANGDTTITRSGVQLSGIYRNITIANGGSATLTGNVQLLGSVVVQAGGSLDCGSYNLNSYSPDFRTYFRVDSLGTLITANPSGISATGNTGSVQTSVFTNAVTSLSSSRDFSSGANYIYTAPIAQASGLALPSVLNGNLTINADSSVQFSNTKQTINGTLTLSTGKLILPAADTLTLGGTVTHTNGSISVNATSDLVFNGSAAKALYFTPNVNTVHNVTINATASSVSLDNALNITSGSNYGVVVCDGGLNTNGNLTLKSDEQGTAAVGQSAGTITGNATVERFTSGNLNQGQFRRAWHLITSPVNGPSVHVAWQENGINNNSYGTLITGYNMPDSATAAAQGYDFIGAGLGTSIRHYLPASDSWAALSSDGSTTGTLIPVRKEQAYLLFVRGNRTIGTTGSSIATVRAAGSLLQGNQAVALTPGTGSSYYTMVGNPYASPIDFASVYSHNNTLLQNKFYIWNSKFGTYGMYALVSKSGSQYVVTPSQFSGSNDDNYRYIPSGSGFEVFAATGVTSGNITIQESDKAPRSVPPISPFRVVAAGNVRQLLINLNQRTSDTSALLADGFRAMFSDDYADNEKDNSSTKAVNLNENLGLVREGDSLIIEARADVKKTDTLFMKMWNVVKRSYQFQMKGDNFTSAPGIRAWLEDSYLKTKQPVDLSGNITTINFDVNADSASWNSDRFRIVFENNTSALPVTITKLSAQPKNGGVEVGWTVTNEINVKGYTIEKSVDGGRTFTSVGTQQPARNNPQAAVTSYSGYDAQPVIGDNYYRIRIEGKDGTVTYSTVVKVTIGQGGSSIRITLYPNPVREGKANLLLVNLKQGAYLVSVYSGSGQTVFQKKIYITLAGTSQTEQLIMGNTLAQGSYQVKLTDSNGNVIFNDQFVILK